MDSFTQIVLGAAVGEAVLGKKIGNKAMIYGAVAGTIPDLDMLSGYFTDTLTAIEWHRGITHSILFAIIVSPIFGYIVSRIEKKALATVIDWTLLFFWCFFTHSLLDIFTTWGTQLFWPIDLRLAIKSIFVIDPLYTLPLLVFLILASRKKTGSKIRKKNINAGLIISSFYLVITLLLKGLTYAKFSKALDNNNLVYERLENKPTAFNAILWNAVAETESDYLLADYSFFDSQLPVFKSYSKNHELLKNLAFSTEVERLINISEGWYTITQKDDEFYFNDLRFGLLNPDSNPPQFSFSYKLTNKNGEIVISEVPKGSKDGKILLQKLWKRLWGN